jgi:HlyD family type I secretion membrane fusion protein
MTEPSKSLTDPKSAPETANSAMQLLARLSERAQSPQLQPQRRTGGPSDSIKGVALAGWTIIGLFFGVFGAWAFSAPLNGAVVANGVIKVEGNRKSIQHLDGGIVKELRVRDSDKVKAGDVLIVLDDNQARAEYEVLTQQYYVLRITEERLRAEYSRMNQVNLPADLADVADDPDVKNIWRGQIHQFESRLTAVEGQRKVLREKIAQLQSQIKGSEGQLKSYRAQYESTQ